MPKVDGESPAAREQRAAREVVASRRMLERAIADLDAVIKLGRLDASEAGAVQGARADLARVLLDRDWLEPDAPTARLAPEAAPR